MAPRDPLAALEAGKRVAEDLAAELVGTYILILIGVGSILVDQRVKITLLGVALVWGTAVTVLVYTLGHISGCHLNPAVTIAFSAIRQFPWKLVVPYVVVQVLGATLASLTLRMLFVGVDADLMQSHPAGTTSNLNAVACEIIVSLILMFVICGSATDAMAVKELAGVAIEPPSSSMFSLQVNLAENNNDNLAGEDEDNHQATIMGKMWEDGVANQCRRRWIATKLPPVKKCMIIGLVTDGAQRLLASQCKDGASYAEALMGTTGNLYRSLRR
ncbi:hypothetical protein J5N97_016987 [Dioscorea zingiberensis]|uniref:Uncharacterized protein n=1 Tax=Dioscorea zingiberensis TaxID=325984 RepID=A0A9D5CL14_9LILI|nr:hypothetical protein J5N97_016987 [Dioscorea zingiberensis]